MTLLSVFLKGILMGICDLIPGISGGTIAFITGIYPRLINSVSNIPKLLYSLVRLKNVKKSLAEADLLFLSVLVLGILTAILLGSRAIKFLLDNYFNQTIAFFIGLVLASCLIIFKEIRSHENKNKLFGILGFVIGIVLCFAVPLEIEPSLLYVFLGGFIGISAMFLPGISGAFILLIMGLYEFIIDALHDFNLKYLFVFGIGALLGAFIISKIISYLFKRNRCKILYFLLGLVLGALSIPIKRIYVAGFGITGLILMIFFFLVGFYIVIKISNYRR
jgi:putative membrane protein